MATSREILRIQGEHVYRVPPLDVPATEQNRSGPAFWSTARWSCSSPEPRSSDADFASNAENLPDDRGDLPPSRRHPARHRVRRRPRRDAWASSRSPRGLRDRFALLTSGRRTALPRHRTLRATLDWSYQLLSEAEQELLRRLAIFAGPFSLDAACAVAAEGTSHAEIADGIADLVGKSLVFRTADPVDAPNFVCSKPTRVYALDRLTESGALAEVARRHAAYFLDAAREHRRRTAVKASRRISGRVSPSCR